MVLQTVTIGIIMGTMQMTEQLENSLHLLITFAVLTFFTFLFYSLSAFRNPGYVLGNNPFDSIVRIQANI